MSNNVNVLRPVFFCVSAIWVRLKTRQLAYNFYYGVSLLSIILLSSLLISLSKSG